MTYTLHFMSRAARKRLMLKHSVEDHREKQLFRQNFTHLITSLSSGIGHYGGGRYGGGRYGGGRYGGAFQFRVDTTAECGYLQIATRYLQIAMAATAKP